MDNIKLVFEIGIINRAIVPFVSCIAIAWILIGLTVFWVKKELKRGNKSENI